MTKRKTHCLTWGEPKYLHRDQFITLCGLDDTENTADLPCDLNPSEPRPKGVCRECWKEYRNQMLSNLFCEECPK